ncbi:hypothetical protein Xbed_02385 [Xenorhabdus beddingii]|uniref:Uncharacterized protein n=1 Tax=Xenorhabdus beddingii TaxID=40578 RepID=A0A1Y2SNQ7_9GAMM|nr:hypothetical protein [Xenorhabdus beddingii]OTA19343.1 hypothetical protein Xbed_02385 [Xenorhabdus beddingii]
MTIILNFLRMIRINLRRKTSYLDFCFIFLCIWTLTSVGSEAQYYLFKFISSDSSTLYGSAFEDAIAKIPTLNQYILKTYSLANNYNYVAVFFIVLSSLFFQSTVQIFVVCIISSVFMLTATDITFLLVNNALSIKSIVECIIANTIGSPIISTFVIFLFYIKRVFLNLNNVSIIFRHVASYICYILTCFVILTVSYYVICFFYRPTNVDFSVSTSQYFSGSYFIDKKNIQTDINKTNRNKEFFSMLGSPIKIKKEIQVYGDIGMIQSRFKKDESYKVRIYFLLNCFDGLNSNVSHSNPLIFNDVKNFTLKYSESFSTVHINDNSGYIKSTDEIVNMFSVNNNKKNGYNINKTNDGTLSYFPSDSEASLYITIPVVEYNKNQIKKNTNFTLFINGIQKTLNIETERLRSSKKNIPIECKIASLDSLNNQLDLKVNDAIYIGLLIKIEPDAKNEFYTPINDDSSRIEIKGKLLHILSKDIMEHDLFSEYFKNGYISGILLHNFDKLSLNGKSIESNEMDNLMIMGSNIYASTSSNNNLVVAGKANLFYRNRLRENKTLWESSSDNTLILGGIGALFLSLLAWGIKKVISTLRKDENINLF